MENFAKRFVRVEHGMWECVSDGAFNFPQVRVEVTSGATFTRGTTFNGFDLAKWLDEQNGIKTTSF